MFGMMETPQRLREAPDVLPRPSAGEQAEGGLQEVLQPQAQRRLALLACQEATVNSLSLKKKKKRSSGQFVAVGFFFFFFFFLFFFFCFWGGGGGVGVSFDYSSYIIRL